MLNRALFYQLLLHRSFHQINCINSKRNENIIYLQLFPQMRIEPAVIACTKRPLHVIATMKHANSGKSHRHSFIKLLRLINQGANT